MNDVELYQVDIRCGELQNVKADGKVLDDADAVLVRVEQRHIIVDVFDIDKDSRAGRCFRQGRGLDGESESIVDGRGRQLFPVYLADEEQVPAVRIHAEIAVIVAAQDRISNSRNGGSSVEFGNGQRAVRVLDGALDADGRNDRHWLSYCFVLLYQKQSPHP